MARFAASTHVWVRELPHDAGTVFEIVDTPRAPTEISRDLAERFERNGWGIIEEKGALTRATASPHLSPEGRGEARRVGHGS